ncbi:MAG: ParA family protein, partial [Ruminococcaceae bacterium]|nr:ParA family protein [Oscillospiraceae bacterium]
ADTVMIPIQCEYYALEGLSQLMGTIRNVKRNLNKDIDIEGVLLTMFDTRTNLSIQVADEVKKFYPKKVYKTVIPRNVRISEAPSFGEPIHVYDPHCKGTDSYMELAEEIINANKEVI